MNDNNIDLEMVRRLQEIIPAEKVLELGIARGLAGIRLDRIRNGKKGVTLDSFGKICKAFDISPAWLLFGRGPKTMRELDDAQLIIEIIEHEKNSGVVDRTRIRKLIIEILERKLSDVFAGKRIEKTLPDPCQTSPASRRRRVRGKG